MSCYSIAYHGLPDIRTYVQAETRFDSVKPVRGWDPNFRPLARRSDASKLIVRHERDGQVEYSCRYHSTDCVTFLPNDVVRLRPYRSQNTDMFVHSITGIMTHYNSSLGACIHAYAGSVRPLIALHRQYLLSDHANAHGFDITKAPANSWQLCNEAQDTQPIAFYRVNRTVANAAYRAAGINAFSAWVKVASTMAPQVFEADYASLQRNKFLDTHLPLLQVEHQSEWAMLAQTYGPTVLDKVRDFILRDTPESIRVEYRPFIEAADEKAAYASYRKYGSIVL